MNIAIHDALLYIQEHKVFFLVRKSLVPPPREPIVVRVQYRYGRSQVSLFFGDELLNDPNFFEEGTDEERRQLVHNAYTWPLIIFGLFWDGPWSTNVFQYRDWDDQQLLL